tara:strand:+ start:482 stop:760 length:279 start_codon:yes stop_codon:yes gene_type:complete
MEEKMKLVKQFSLKSNKKLQVREKLEEKRPVGRPKIFKEIKTYGFTFPPIYRKILQKAAEERRISASELIRQWIDTNFKDKYIAEVKGEEKG